MGFVALTPAVGVSHSVRARAQLPSCTNFQTTSYLRKQVTSPRASSRGAENMSCVPRCCQTTSLASRSKDVVLGLVLSGFLAGAAQGADPAEVFQRTGCVGCHAGGGNVVQAGASLQTKDLEKNGAATVDAIYKLIYSGKGKMPGYGKECQPRGKCTFGPRLAEDDIQRLSQYVLDKAAVQWKQ